MDEKDAVTAAALLNSGSSAFNKALTAHTEAEASLARAEHIKAQTAQSQLDSTRRSILATANRIQAQDNDRLRKAQFEARSEVSGLESRVKTLEQENAELRATLKEWVASQRGLMALAKAMKEKVESCPNREHHKLADSVAIAEDAAEASYNSNDVEEAKKIIPWPCPTHGEVKERKALRQQKFDIAMLVDEGRLYLVADQRPATWKEGFALWLEHAEAGNPQAQFNVGRCYVLGEGVESDLAKANEWYLKATEENDPRAFFNLYLLYQNEKFAQCDAAQAQVYLHNAVELEEPRAIKEAMRLQEKAAQEEAIRIEQERLAKIEADPQQKLQDELRAFKKIKVASVDIIEETQRVDTDFDLKIYSALFRLENISPGVQFAVACNVDLYEDDPDAKKIKINATTSLKESLHK